MEAADSLNAKIASSAESPPTSADAFEMATAPNVLIYLNMDTTLTTQIGSAMAIVADSMKEMTAAFEKQHQHPQVYSSSDNNCVVDALASRSCSQDGERGTSHSVSMDVAASDFTPHGYQPTHPASPVTSLPQCSSCSLNKWSTKSTLDFDSDDSPSKHSVNSLEAEDVDKFDVAARQLTAMTVSPPGSSPTLPTGSQVDTFYNKYMEEYQPDSLVGPAVSDVGFLRKIEGEAFAGNAT